MSAAENTMVAIDGTDALAFVIIRPGSAEGGVSIEAAANGMSKQAAAYVLRHVADQFDAEGAKRQADAPQCRHCGNYDGPFVGTDPTPICKTCHSLHTAESGDAR